VIVTRCGHGMSGCIPPTDDERLQAYARALGGRYDAHQHARRASAGLAILARLRKLWRMADRKRKTKAKPATRPAARKSNVIAMRRRA
jgi:hypothetical protein